MPDPTPVVSPPRGPGQPAGRCRAGRLLLITALLLAPTAGSLAQSAPSLLQRLRGLLGIQRPLAVAGSRSPTWPIQPAAGGGASAQASQPLFCVFSPWTAKANSDGSYTAVTRSGTPPIAANVPLADVQILRAGVLIHRQRATSVQPIETPLAWPLPPLAPGEQLDLILRPLGSSDTLRMRLVRAPLPAGLDAQALVRAGEMEQVLGELLAADSSQRSQTVALLARSCKPSA